MCFFYIGKCVELVCCCIGNFLPSLYCWYSICLITEIMKDVIAEK